MNTAAELQSPFEDLTPLGAAAADPGGPAHLRMLQAWVDEFLSTPNVELGRSGPVCPFARAASEGELLWAATVPGAELELSAIKRGLQAYTELFRRLEPRQGPLALRKAILITFPELDDVTVIDSLQQDLKTEFVQAGLMIGQFYPGCAAPGMWNSDFRPLDCPVPLIAIRQMVSSDFIFLNGRDEWVQSYLSLFATADARAGRRQAAAAQLPGLTGSE